MKCKLNVHFDGFQQGKPTERDDQSRSDAFKKARNFTISVRKSFGQLSDLEVGALVEDRQVFTSLPQVNLKVSRFVQRACMEMDLSPFTMMFGCCNGAHLDGTHFDRVRSWTQMHALFSLEYEKASF